MHRLRKKPNSTPVLLKEMTPSFRSCTSPSNCHPEATHACGPVALKVRWGKCREGSASVFALDQGMNLRGSSRTGRALEAAGCETVKL
jgi:hypothetical protein